ncbi:LysR family transcriptional regulator [Mangrovicoccus sp. HB161399]|uniref:LysR family transcriptional regulator n=1 Tax=Mangrovicoccus sp. HB161399 TaxID=2720392 RepID=UPI001552FE75|nr:LysR family transcriptional regulator [Mangrovicoccus sp. HB161399]
MLYHWDDIRFFLEIHRAGSLTGAARRLKVSHTTVARHLARLERDLDVELVEKAEDGLRLTQAGFDMLSLARAMEDTGTSIGDRMAAKGTAVTGTVRVGAPDGFGNAVLSSLLPALRREHPGIELELVPVPVTHKLWRRDVDIAISLDRPETGRLVMRKLADYDLRLYGAPELLAAGMPQEIADLAGFDFVGYIPDLLYTEELNFNAQIAPGLRVPYRAATVQAQLDAVRAGAGLGVLPCYMAAGTGLLPVLPDRVGFSRTYWLLIPEEIRDWQKVRLVAEHIAAALRRDAARFRFRAAAGDPS